MNEDTFRQAEQELKQADPILGRLIASQSIEYPVIRTDYFASLSRSIIGQQVSVAAARAIATRFEEQTDLNPAKVTSLSEDQIKLIGLSRQKASYIMDLAHHFVADPDIYNHLESQTDEQIISELTDVKGIGEWTAQMFLMFTLARPDVFAPADGGLQRAMMSLHGWSTLPAKESLVQAAEIWRPYRTVACLHLWRSLDNTPS